jgi:5-methylcytosine-specific restriction endonuclease McrA
MAQHRLPPIEWRREKGLLLTSAAQRKACLARDKGICGRCKSLGGAWNADHIHALNDITASAPFPAALKYWRIGNLETLCEKCYWKKSVAEVKANAKVKRIRRRLDGTRRPQRRVPSRPVKKPTKPFKRTPDKRLGQHEYPPSEAIDGTTRQPRPFTIQSRQR